MPKASWGNLEGADSIWEDELEDFPVYDGELPPKGVYRLVLKTLRLKKNKNDDPMLNALLIINEPAGSKKSQYNGKDVWANLNVTRQGAPWVNNFISALVPENKVAAVRKAFWAQKVMVDKEEPPNVLSIGAVKIEAGKLLISAQCGHKTYNGDTDLDAKRFFRPSDTTLNEDGATPAADGDEDEWEEETEAEEAETEDPAEDADDEYDARAEELEAMTRAELLRAAKAAGVSVKRGTPESDIIDDILEAEFPEDGELDEDEDEDEPEEEEEEEVEPEPEPPKATRTRRARPAAASKAEEPPARARTGTRRRKGDEPPF
jgi:hypothetical protein